MPGSAADSPTLRITTKEVLVPTLVEKHGGGIVYGLKGDDFLVEDNGVPQKVHVQEEMDTAPVSLVVAVEQGGMSVLEFDKVAKLGPLLDSFSPTRAARPHWSASTRSRICSAITRTSGDQLNQTLKTLEPGDGGDAILDTVSYAVDLLQTQPKEYRRVLLLISEERDHGSKHESGAGDQEDRRVGCAGAHGVVFSDSRRVRHDIKDSGEERTMSMVSALVALVQAFKKNVTKEIAQMSGGEYTTFTSDKKFEARVVDEAKHARNRYLLTFSPSNPAPGLHTLKVRLAQDYGARVVARANYWIEEGQ